MIKRSQIDVESSVTGFTLIWFLFDQELHNYWDGTYHSSDRFGAKASIRFQGTAIWLYAAKRSRHGPFEIFLDGQKVYDGDGYSATPLYDQVMYSVADLAPTWHNLTCINSDTTNQTYTEVDYIRWTTVMPEALTESLGTAIPYSPNNMSYSSLNAWSEDTVGSNPSMATSTNGASVNVTFNGNGIELYGRTGPSFGWFSAQIDDLDELQFNANSEQTHTTLLFRQDNLTSGRHNLVVTNRGPKLAVTSAKPILWKDPNEPTPDSGSSAETTHTGLIAGVVVGVVVGLSAIAFILLFVLRKRRRKQQENDLRVHSSQGPAFLDATPFELPTSPNEQSSSIQSPSSLAQNSKYRTESSQYAAYPLQYQPVLGSPGMSSRGSFDVPQNLGVPGSSTGGSSSDRPTSRKHRYSTEPISRDELPEGVHVIRDSDAGPILLPPAYSAATESRTPVELPQPTWGVATPVTKRSTPTTPVPGTPFTSTSVPTSNTPNLPPGAASPVIPNPNPGRE
ncbi:unnamed protein product [Rhizoctonia solani]|uniref:Uncharacterized protein n=1 Tax=Rhizoctonia solani TaxID=456999 RepID=A0A8H2WID0_9AGAM|nr:unnamed protein product [Rhizoctonia solani]